MIIQEEDFILENVEESDCWDIKVPGTKSNPWKLAAYGVPLRYALEKLVHIRLANKQDVYTLKTFLAAYREERVKLFKLIKDYGL